MRSKPWMLGGLAAVMLAGLFACEVEETKGCIIERRGADRMVSSISGDCSGKNLDGVDLSQADVEVYNWSNTICPDGTPSSQNNNTCAGHLSPDGNGNNSDPDVGMPDMSMPDTNEPDTGMLDVMDVDPPDMPMDPVEDMMGDDMPEDMMEDLPPGPCMTPKDCFTHCVLFDREANPLSPIDVALPDGDWHVEFWVFLIRQTRSEEEVMTLFQMVSGGEVLFTFDLELRDPGLRSDAALWANNGSREEDIGYVRTLDTLESNDWHHIAVDSDGTIFIDGSEATSSKGGNWPSVGGAAVETTLYLGSSTTGVGFYGSIREFYLKPDLLPGGSFTPVILQDMPAQIDGLSWRLDPTAGVPLMGNSDEPSWTLGDANVGPCPRRQNQ